MTRRALFSAFFVTPLFAFSADDLLPRARNFNQHWGRFYRSLLGCPKGATDEAECRPQLGTVDYSEFAKCQQAAREVFPL